MKTINQKKIGVILAYLSHLIHIVTGIIYTPLMLKYLGQSEYGLYRLVKSTTSYLTLLSLGFGSSYIHYYSKEKTNNNEEGVGEVNGMFLAIFSILSIICLICGIIITFNVRLIFDQGLTDFEYTKAKILLIIFTIDIAFALINTVFGCIILAFEKFIFHKIIILFQYLAGPMLIIPLLITGHDSISLVLVSLALTLISLIANIYYCLRKLKVKFIFRNINFSILKEMWTFTFFIFIIQIVDRISLEVGGILVGRYYGTNDVAVYSISSQIIDIFINFGSAITTVYTPEINRIVSNSNQETEINNIFNKIGRIEYLILVWIYSGLIVFGKQFITIWAGEDFVNAYYYTLILLGSFLIPLIQDSGYEIIKAKNKHKSISIVYLVCALFNIIISIPLTKKFGCFGACIGTAISVIISKVFYLNAYFYRTIKIDIFNYFKQILSFLPSTLIALGLGLIYTRFVISTNYLSFGLGVIIYSIIYWIIIYFKGMNNEEKDFVKENFNKIFKH